MTILYIVIMYILHCYFIFQIVYARFGKVAHITFCILALFANLVTTTSLLLAGKAAIKVWYFILTVKKKQLKAKTEKTTTKKRGFTVLLISYLKYHPFSGIVEFIKLVSTHNFSQFQRK